MAIREATTETPLSTETPEEEGILPTMEQAVRMALQAPRKHFGKVLMVVALAGCAHEQPSAPVPQTVAATVKKDPLIDSLSETTLPLPMKEDPWEGHPESSDKVTKKKPSSSPSSPWGTPINSGKLFKPEKLDKTLVDPWGKTSRPKSVKSAQPSASVKPVEPKTAEPPKSSDIPSFEDADTWTPLEVQKEK